MVLWTIWGRDRFRGFLRTYLRLARPPLELRAVETRDPGVCAGPSDAGFFTGPRRMDEITNTTIAKHTDARSTKPIEEPGMATLDKLAHRHRTGARTVGWTFEGRHLARATVPGGLGIGQQRDQAAE